MSRHTEKQPEQTPIRHAGEEMVSYSLPELLPAQGHVLIIHRRLELLSHLAPGEAGEPPRLLAQEQFSLSEMRVLLPLLEQYPAYCPYEVLLASFTTGSTAAYEIERFRLRLQEAQFAGVWDYEMRPVRNVLSRVRFKLRAFGLDVRAILETGYLLKPLAASGRETTLSTEAH